MPRREGIGDAVTQFQELLDAYAAAEARLVKAASRLAEHRAAMQHARGPLGGLDSDGPLAELTGCGAVPGVVRRALVRKVGALEEEAQGEAIAEVDAIAQRLSRSSDTLTDLLSYPPPGADSPSAAWDDWDRGALCFDVVSSALSALVSDLCLKRGVLRAMCDADAPRDLPRMRVQVAALEMRPLSSAATLRAAAELLRQAASVP
eukprot:Hpha_TRINITY_DN20063_c0_g1::TRINITY_DN20063_c0_g1_i1::g.147708::m.147708